MEKINILVPELPESVNDATVSTWHKKLGDVVHAEENIVDIETDKVMLEVTSPCDGVLKIILEKEGKIVNSQQILGIIEKLKTINIKKFNDSIHQKKNTIEQKENIIFKEKIQHLTPSKRRLRRIHQTNNAMFLQNNITENNTKVNNIKTNDDYSIKNNQNVQTRTKMTRLRQRIAERLLESQKNTAMLTTFNEVNMQPVILLRKKYGVYFEKIHGIRMGFMSFYVKAVVEALKKFPIINAYIDDQDIVYHKNFDISIALSTPRGLITPVLRNADNMSMSEIEKKIKDFSLKALENKIDIKELIGGNFTITNGGVFGSLMSTPIINPPQTAILGMHLIQDRPVAVNGKIKILPMMYLALSYDHRLIDGKESVSFLVNIKHILEDFTRITMNI